MRTMLIQAAQSKCFDFELSHCLKEHKGGGTPPVHLAKREANLMTELIRLETVIRLSGGRGPMSDVIAKVDHVESLDHEVTIFLDFSSITDPPTPPMEEKVFDYFVVNQENGQLVVYAREHEEDLPLDDWFNVKIVYLDENITGSLAFMVTDKISDIVVDAGSAAIQAAYKNKDGEIVAVNLPQGLLDCTGEKGDPSEFDQYDKTGPRLLENRFYVESNKYPLTTTELIEKPSANGRFRSVTRKDDPKTDLIQVPNAKLCMLSDLPFGMLDAMTIFLKTVMVALHAVCTCICKSVEEEYRPLAIHLNLMTPNVLTQEQLTKLMERLTSLVNNYDFLNQYGLRCVDTRSVSESDCALFAFIGESKHNFTDKFFVIDAGKSTRDWTIADVKGRKIQVLSRGGDLKGGGNTITWNFALELVTAFEAHGQLREDLIRRLLMSQPYYLARFFEIAEQKKKSFKRSATLSPLNLTDDSSKLSVEKILEIMETLPMDDTYGIISQMIEDNVEDLESMLRQNGVKFLLLSGRTFLFAPLREKIEEIARQCGVKEVFGETDPYKLKSAPLYGGFAGFQKDYNLVGYPEVKVAAPYRTSQSKHSWGWKIIEILGCKEGGDGIVRRWTGDYPVSTPLSKVQYDEKQLKSGGILIPFSENIRIYVNGVEYHQVSEIITSPDYHCYIALRDGDFYLRQRDKESLLEPITMAKGSEHLLGALFPWSLTLKPTLSLENLPEAKIKS